MSNADDSKDKLETLRLLEEHTRITSEIKSKGQGIVEAAQLELDVNSSVKKLVQDAPGDSALPHDTWIGLQNKFRTSNELANRVNLNLSGPNSYHLIAQANVSSTVSAVSAIVQVVSSANWVRPAALKEVSAFIGSHTKIPDIEGSLHRLGLDKIHGDVRSPLSLIEEAKMALDRPTSDATYPTAVLIPLRSCINLIIDQLLRRRRLPEAASSRKAKVLSICNQCCKSGIDPVRIDSLAASADEQNDVLSSYKDRSASRAQLQIHFDSAVLFIKSFLDALDETKLKT